MESLPDDILHRIVTHVTLDTLIALEQTSTRFKTLLTALDASVTRDRVLERVPWMTPNTPNLVTWLKCGRLILARHASVKKERRKWTFLNGTATSLKQGMTKLIKNTDIHYIAANNVDGRSLPESFEPLFEAHEFWSRNGIFSGKYMSVQDCYLDAVTFDWSKEKPPKPGDPGIR